MDYSGLYVRNSDSGFRARFGNIAGELLYDAREFENRHLMESLKRSGPLLGLHLRWKF